MQGGVKPDRRRPEITWSLHHMKTAKKIIILIFGLAFLASPVQAFAATLSLSPSDGTFNSGCTFSVDIMEDSAGVQTDGTDVILFYDKSKLSVSSITNGTLYPDYPVSADQQQISPDAQTISPQASTGQIDISGLASVDTPVTAANAKFATVTFAVSPQAPAGGTQINFDFDPNNPGKTTDSNIVQRGTVADVLSGVTDGNYTIGTGSCGVNSLVTGSGTGLTASGSGFQTTPGIGGETSTISGVPVQTLPNRGASGQTIVLAAAGGILTILGILGLALL